MPGITIRAKIRLVTSHPTVSAWHRCGTVAILGLTLVTCASDGVRAVGAQADFVALIARVSPSVVAVGDDSGTLGSGFVVRPGVVVTAAHVVAAAHSQVSVLVGTRRYPARLLGSDEPQDLALLQVALEPPPVPMTLAASAGRVGEWIVVLGNPFGAGTTATIGIVSAAPGVITSPASLAQRIQINASVNPGNSGGPVVNTRGEVVGVANALLPGGQGLGFASTADAVRGLLASIQK